MNKLNKNYLVIKNVNQDKNLKQYLEQICCEEKVNILHEEFNQFDVWNNKQSVYSEFNASPSSDILLWSYESCKLDYINYLYTDFEARYKNAGHVVNRILESVNNGDNLDEGEKLDIAIRDDLSKGWNKLGNAYTFTIEFNDLKPQEEKFATLFQKFRQKVSNFYNKHAEKIMYLFWGIALSNLFILVVLTLKHFMVK